MILFLRAWCNYNKRTKNETNKKRKLVFSSLHLLRNTKLKLLKGKSFDLTSFLPVGILASSRRSLPALFQVLQFLYETVQFFVYVRPRQRAKARRKARMKKKLQRAEEETVRPQGTMSTALTGGFQPNGMRQLSMMNLPKDIYSNKI